jgi:hypothetical protein
MLRSDLQYSKSNIALELDLSVHPFVAAARNEGVDLSLQVRDHEVVVEHRS